MAQPGTFTAYRQLKPLEGDVAQDIQQQEENGFRRRALAQAEERTQNDKADKEAERKQQLWDKHVKPLSNYDTGSKTLNEAQGRLILEAQKEYVPLMSVLNNPKASDDEKLKATLKLQNINKLPENLLSMTKSLTERDLTIRKGVQDGTLFANPDYEKNYQEGYQNKLLALDENGMPMVAFKDLDGDGKNDLETYDQIQNVVPKYDIQQRFDRDTELVEASKKLLPVVNQTDDGFKKVKTTAVDPALLKAYVDNQLFEADGITPTAKLKSFARESGVPFDDAKGLQTLSDKFENDIRLRIKGGTETTRNNSALDYQKEANDQKEKRLARADKKEKDSPVPTVIKTKEIAFVEDIVKPSKYLGKDGKMHVSNPKIENDKMLPQGYSFGKGIKLDNIGGEKTGLNNVAITTVSKGKDGKMYFTAKVLDEKSSGEKVMGSEGEVAYKYGAKFKAVSRQATGETAAVIARAMGYDSEDAALKAIDELNGIDPNKPQKATKKEDLRSKYNY